jgi:hypothetical protein
MFCSSRCVERDHLAGAQAGSIGHAQRRFVFKPRRRVEEPRNFFRAEYDRQPARLANELRVLDDRCLLERDPEKEPQRRYRVIENGRMRAALRQMQLKTPDVLEARRVGRSAEESGELLDDADVALLGLRR